MNAKSSYGPTGVQLYESLLDPLLASFRTAITRVCVAHNFRQIVDVGSGTGSQGLSLGTANIGYTGLDNAATMLCVAKKRMGSSQSESFQCESALVQGDALHLPFRNKSVDAVLLSLILHQMDEVSHRSVLREALRVGRHVIIADYRTPERNLDYMGFCVARFFERLAGSAHYAHYKVFLKQGGIEGCLHPRHGTASRITYREPVLLGAATLLVCTPLE